MAAIVATERAPPQSKWSNHTDMAGSELLARLQRLRPERTNDWLIEDFVRIIGVSRRRVERWVSGESDGDIPLWVEVVIFFMETSPASFASDPLIPQRLEAPFAEVAAGMRLLGDSLRRRDHAASVVAANAITNSYRQLANQIEAMNESA